MSGLAQTFSDAKVVDSPALNRIGAQPFRAVAARLLARTSTVLGHGGFQELARSGLVVVEDFLPIEEFARVRTEASELSRTRAPTLVVPDGGTRTDIWSLPVADGNCFPALDRWCADEAVFDLASAAEGIPVRPEQAYRTLEHLHIDDPAGHDGQSDLHIDAPFDTHKLWLYLDDVTPDHPSFVYVPGSHKLDATRLRNEYVESIGENQRSRRVADDEVRRRGLEARTVVCRANTLVFANTCGYHCRSTGTAGATRVALHMMFRSNPFDLRRRVRPLVRGTSSR